MLAAVSAYRMAMRGFAEQSMMDVWYAHLDIEETLTTFKSQLKPKRYKSTEAMLAKARTRDSTQALSKLTTIVDGQRRIISDPPLIVPVEELFSDMQSDEIYGELAGLVASTAAPCSPTGATCWSSSPWSRRPARSWGWAVSGPERGSCSWSPETASSRLFLQAKEAQRRCSPTSPGAARSPTRASVSWRAST